MADFFRPNLDRFPYCDADLDPPQYECDGCGHFIVSPGYCHMCYMTNISDDDREEKDHGRI